VGSAPAFRAGSTSRTARIDRDPQSWRHAWIKIAADLYGFLPQAQTPARRISRRARYRITASSRRRHFVNSIFLGLACPTDM